ncbi:dnaJ homolog subfamily C member 12 [Chanos chanos]|uniref:DnaJ homolog subfamily C member 12 n=1 Tax=Chanos chanos TaxID=29144 RepID=A0A6J2V213_CHACN|nr:dnaJ homolog subfamily C member 12 [Chanos chanos]
MEAILNCRSEDLEDFYGLLGCDELSTTEQILNEFKVRALACHPDKHPENPKAVEDFQKLQRAKEVLTDEGSRKRYDLWRRCQIAIPFSEWESLSDCVKTSLHWAVKPKKEAMLEAPHCGFDSSPQGAVPQADGGGSLQEQCSDRGLCANPQIGDYQQQHFRWAGDVPSGLLQKFRNYEI